jgi:indole-3-glycerol phosphate synthase
MVAECPPTPPRNSPKLAEDEPALVESYEARRALALSVLNHRPACQESFDLAIEALNGVDIIAKPR